jgi:hypothetical protein
LISASTSLTCSCFLRRRVVAPCANSSVSVTKSMPPASQAKPGPARRWRCRLFVAGLELGQRVEGGRVQAAGAQKVQQAFAPARAFGQQQHALGAGADVGLQRASGSSAPRVAVRSGSLREGAVAHIGCRAQRQLGSGLAAVELFGAQEQRLGRQHRPLGVALGQAVALARVLPEALEGRSRSPCSTSVACSPR